MLQNAFFHQNDFAFIAKFDRYAPGYQIKMQPKSTHINIKP